MVFSLDEKDDHEDNLLFPSNSFEKINFILIVSGSLWGHYFISALKAGY